MLMFFWQISLDLCFAEHNFTDMSTAFITLLIQVSNLDPSVVRNKSAEERTRKKKSGRSEIKKR